MERLWVVLALALLAAMAPTANAREAENAAFCLGCTTDAQFKLAAVEGFGAGLEGSRQALVGNPNTDDFRQVMLTRTAAGVVKVAAMSRLALDKAEAKFSDDVQTKIFITNCNGVVQLPSSASHNADAADGGGHAVERGTLVRLDAKVYGLVLCQSPLFESYSSAKWPTLSRALQLAALRWAFDRKGIVKVYGKMTTDTGGDSPVQPTPKPQVVCTIFNNGDSTCFRMSGTPDDNSGSGSSGLAIVNRGSQVDYGAPGSTGEAGETWLVCDEGGGQVSDCHTTIR